MTLLFAGFFAQTSLFGQENAAKPETGKFFVKPYAGFIGIQDMELLYKKNSHSSNISVDNGFGFTSGISLGYHFSKNISAEIGWEYKTNESTITNSSAKSTGDYASNFIYVNGIYNFTTQGKLKPYMGVGASLIQEIDLDLVIDGVYTSFSRSGNIGFQGIAGLDFNFAKKWALNWEAKYVNFGEFDMEDAPNNSSMKNLRYNPFIFNIGFKFRF